MSEQLKQTLISQIKHCYIVNAGALYQAETGLAATSDDICVFGLSLGSDGIYTKSDRLVRGYPTWEKKGANSYTIYTLKSRRWGLTKSQWVEDNSNFALTSAKHGGSSPHECIWGKMKGGEFQPMKGLVQRVSSGAEEVAATKLQAAVRGYAVRCSLPIAAAIPLVSSGYICASRAVPWHCAEASTSTTVPSFATENDGEGMVHAIACWIEGVVDYYDELENAKPRVVTVSHR